MSESIRGVAFLWSKLASDIQDQIGNSGRVGDVAARPEPLCVIVPPDETALQIIGSGSVYEALHQLYESVVTIGDCPQHHWHVRMLCNEVKSSL